MPRVIISDRGPKFASELWKEIFRALGSTVALAASHHPQTDGQSERAIQTLSRLLRTYARALPSRWEEILPTIQFALNDAPAAATRYSPFQVLFGRSPIMPADLLIGDAGDRPLSWDIDSSDSLRWVRRW